MRLAGKAVIVTGGAAGIGRVYARRPLAEDARVLIADEGERSTHDSPNSYADVSRGKRVTKI